MKKILVSSLIAIAALAASPTHAANECGKIDFVWMAVADAGLFKFKIINGNTYKVAYKANVTQIAVSQIMTAKSANFNVCIEYNGTTGERDVVNINVMNP
jgi:hypothetical protein